MSVRLRPPAPFDLDHGERIWKNAAAGSKDIRTILRMQRRCSELEIKIL